MQKDEAPSDIGLAMPITLDLRGLKCPMPVLRTRKVLRSLEPGRTVDVLCTDPLAAIDLRNLLRETGDLLLGTTAAGEFTRFAIRKR